MNEDPRTYLGKHKSELVGHVKVAPLRQVAPDSFPDLVLIQVPAVVIIHGGTGCRVRSTCKQNKQVSGGGSQSKGGGGRNNTL